jgi:hypothetical protein
MPVGGTQRKAFAGSKLAVSQGIDVDKALLIKDRRTKIGAGEGNRTLVISLEGFCSTIELHPRAVARRQNSLSPPSGKGTKEKIIAACSPLLGQPRSRDRLLE